MPVLVVFQDAAQNPELGLNTRRNTECEVATRETIHQASTVFLFCQGTAAFVFSEVVLEVLHV